MIKNVYVWKTDYFKIALTLAPMKRNIILLAILMSTLVNGQTIDHSHFDEGRMNEVLFSQMNDYILKNCLCPLVSTNVGKERIYRSIKKNNEQLSLDDLNSKINTKLLRKWDSRAISQTNQVGNVGLICSVACQDFKTYQEIATHCITDWLNSENLIFMRWSQIGEGISFYDKRTQVVLVFWAYFN